MCFVDRDGDKVEATVEVGESFLTAAIDNDVELEGTLFTVCRTTTHLLPTVSCIHQLVIVTDGWMYINNTENSS